VARRIKPRFKMMRRSVTAISVVERRNHAGMKAPMAAMAETIAKNQKTSSVSR
jgi:hypothetical protein